jgi:hypothetical protein
MAVPKKAEARLVAGLKRFQPILASARARDINEADTVTIVKDLLADLFGYDKYTEVTGEHAIRGTYCDLAVKIDGRLELLVEVKAIGLDPKDSHVKQVVDYAANQGVEWVILTNGARWRVYRVVFAKPIDQELVLEFDLTELSHRSGQHLEWLYLLSREAITRSALPDFHTQRQATSRFVLGAIVLSDAVVETVRRELRRMAPEVRIDLDQIRAALRGEVLKREVVEGDQADAARKKVQRAAGKALRAARPRSGAAEIPGAGGEGAGTSQADEGGDVSAAGDASLAPGSEG